jgi:hypothetical protein
MREEREERRGVAVVLRVAAVREQLLFTCELRRENNDCNSVKSFR